MAVVPAARRRGLGAQMVEAWMADSRQRGLRSLVLEVITANTAAVRLYERCGFERVQRLAGWTRRPGQSAVESLSPGQIDPRSVAALVSSRDSARSIPWQIAGESIAAMGPPSTAWQLAGAQVVVSDLSAKVVAVRGLSWEDQAGPTAAARLLRALIARHPDHEWRAPAIFPESWSPAFIESGFQPDTIDQWQMARGL
jgi:hypothetical protein